MSLNEIDKQYHYSAKVILGCSKFSDIIFQLILNILIFFSGYILKGLCSREIARIVQL